MQTILFTAGDPSHAGNFSSTANQGGTIFAVILYNVSLPCSIDRLEYGSCVNFFPASDPYTSLSTCFVQDMGGLQFRRS